MNTDNRIWVKFSIPGETSEHPLVGGAFWLTVPRIGEHIVLGEGDYSGTFRVHHITWQVKENRHLDYAYVVLRPL